MQKKIFNKKDTPRIFRLKLREHQLNHQQLMLLSEILALQKRKSRHSTQLTIQLSAAIAQCYCSEARLAIFMGLDKTQATPLYLKALEHNPESKEANKQLSSFTTPQERSQIITGLCKMNYDIGKKKNNPLISSIVEGCYDVLLGVEKEHSARDERIDLKPFKLTQTYLQLLCLHNRGSHLATQRLLQYHLTSETNKQKFIDKYIELVESINTKDVEYILTAITKDGVYFEKKLQSLNLIYPGAALQKPKLDTHKVSAKRERETKSHDNHTSLFYPGESAKTKPRTPIEMLPLRRDSKKETSRP